eukprot:6232571-Prymnesium_polylepis.1
MLAEVTGDALPTACRILEVGRVAVEAAGARTQFAHVKVALFCQHEGQRLQTSIRLHTRGGEKGQHTVLSPVASGPRLVVAEPTDPDNCATVEDCGLSGRGSVKK